MEGPMFPNFVPLFSLSLFGIVFSSVSTVAHQRNIFMTEYLYQEQSGEVTAERYHGVVRTGNTLTCILDS